MNSDYSGERIIQVSSLSKMVCSGVIGTEISGVAALRGSKTEC